METAKAWVAAAVALLGTVAEVIDDGAVTGPEVGIVVAAAIAAYGAVWKVRNKPAL